MMTPEMRRRKKARKKEGVWVAVVPVYRCGGSPACPRRWTREGLPILVPRNSVTRCSVMLAGWNAITHQAGVVWCRLATEKERKVAVERTAYTQMWRGVPISFAPKYVSHDKLVHSGVIENVKVENLPSRVRS